MLAYYFRKFYFFQKQRLAKNVSSPRYLPAEKNDRSLFQDYQSVNRCKFGKYDTKPNYFKGFLKIIAFAAMCWFMWESVKGLRLF
jgi:hypothetical protein